MLLGLLIVRARFKDRPPPTEEVFRAELLRQVGSLCGLEGFTVGGDNGDEPDVVDVATDMNGLTYPYARKVLSSLGGALQGPPQRSPWYVARPWNEWPWWRRAGLRVPQLVLGLLFVLLQLVVGLLLVATMPIQELVRMVRRARAR